MFGAIRGVIFRASNTINKYFKIVIPTPYTCDVFVKTGIIEGLLNLFLTLAS